jgi:hypothetical protein
MSLLTLKEERANRRHSVAVTETTYATSQLCCTDRGSLAKRIRRSMIAGEVTHL